MNIYGKIESAETKFKLILEEFFIRKRGNNLLYSHDIDHHRRVWNYAKELLTAVAGAEPARISFTIDNLIIACYLHDLGMSVDIGERHGAFSSKLCREFISVSGFSESEFSEAISAIENHDMKDYTLNEHAGNLGTFLNVADDLDAFGHIGIYRYLDIYISRGIHPDKIGHEIRRNANNRFRNFEMLFEGYKELLENHKKRFLVLDNFFADYNSEITLSL